MSRYDPARHRQAVRKGRERGAWIFIPAEELEAANFDPSADPPFYRLYARKKKSEDRPGTILVALHHNP